MHYSVVQSEPQDQSFLFRVGRFQIADQTLKRFLIRVVIFPIAEVGDEILADLAGDF